MIVGLLTGHCRISWYVNKIEDAICRVQGWGRTPVHVLWYSEGPATTRVLVLLAS